MIITHDPTQCCGCLACSLVCPQKCIERTEDAAGFVMPQVDQSKCVQCGLCEKVCPIQKTYSTPGVTAKSVYGAYSRDTALRRRASSGGIFETIAQVILARGGSVFGCKLDENLQLSMYEATTLDQVRQLTKSKYIQSRCHDTFPLIKQRVTEGKYVLVCATPCQTAALANYLGKLTQSAHLFLMDFVCHGVPSQRLFDKCREYTQNKQNSKWTSYEFRFKPPRGVTLHYNRRIEKNAQAVQQEHTYFYFEDPFYLGFEKYITLRDSCYHCPFGAGNHPADITVGDLHEAESCWPEVNRYEGVSKIMINTPKGQELWQQIQPTLCVRELPAKRATLPGPTHMPAQRNAFVADLKELPFEQVVDKWLNPHKQWKKAIYYRLPDWIRLSVKKACSFGLKLYRRINK